MARLNDSYDWGGEERRRSAAKPSGCRREGLIRQPFLGGLIYVLL